jgi:hypothetical protein
MISDASSRTQEKNRTKEEQENSFACVYLQPSSTSLPNIGDDKAPINQRAEITRRGAFSVLDSPFDLHQRGEDCAHAAAQRKSCDWAGYTTACRDPVRTCSRCVLGLPRLAQIVVQVTWRILESGLIVKKVSRHYGIIIGSKDVFKLSFQASMCVDTWG